MVEEADSNRLPNSYLPNKAPRHVDRVLSHGPTKMEPNGKLKGDPTDCTVFRTEAKRFCNMVDIFQMEVQGVKIITRRNSKDHQIDKY
jgi:hypothetical protein